MTTNELLSNLERSRLAPPDVIRQLRKWREQSPESWGPQAVVNWLIDEEYLTKKQGMRMLASADTEAMPAIDEDDLEPADQPQPTDSDELAEFVDEEPPPKPKTVKPSRGARPAAPARDVAPDRPRKEMSKSGKKKPAWREPKEPVIAGFDAGPGFGEDELAEVDDGGAAPVGKKGWFGGHGEEKQHKWDTPLLVIGFAALAFIVIGGVLLYWRLNTIGEADLFDLAEKDYQSGTYAESVQRFDQYLGSYPKGENAPTARVHRGLARMRLLTSAGGDWENVLTESQKIIDEIQGEVPFSENETQGELVTMIPMIAEGLAKSAVQKLDTKYIDMSRAALKLLNNVRTSMLPSQKMLEIEAALALAEQKIGRERKLAESLTEMTRLLDARQTYEAYAERRKLLKLYPDAATDERLVEVVLKLSEANKGVVAFEKDSRAAETSERASPITGSVNFAATTTPGTASGISGEVIGVLAQGAAYGVDASTGRALWRRYVGYDSIHAPQSVAPTTPGADLIVSEIDSSRQRYEVSRVDAKTGDLRWRIDIGEPFSTQPTVVGERLLVATRGSAGKGGKLVTIDLTSGEYRGGSRFPLALTVAPAVGPGERVYYQVADHSDLYVVSPRDGTCLECVYLGHERDAIRVAPLVSSRYVFIFENREAGGSQMRVFLSGEGGAQLKQIHVETFAGQIQSAPQVSKRNLFVATDRNALYAFEINPPGSDGKPLNALPNKPPEEREAITHFPLIQEAKVWVAGLGITRYDIESAKGRLSPQWLKDDNDYFLQPPRILGDIVIHTRQKDGQPGVAVSAIKIDDGARIWETQLGAAGWGDFSVDTASGKVTLVNSVGALFETNVERVVGARVEPAVALANPRAKALPTASGPVDLGSGRLSFAVGDGQPRLLMVEPPGGAQRLRWLTSPAPLSAAPVLFTSGILAPSQVGQVFVLDGTTGASLVEPFQPTVAGAQKFIWGKPAILDNGDVLLADGRGMLYLLGVVDQPKPHLAARKEVQLLQPLVTPLAAIDNVAYAVDQTGLLRAISLPDLGTEAEMPPLGGACSWGPARVGDAVYLTTSRGGADHVLWRLDAKRQVTWQKPLSRGALAGAPLLEGDTLSLSFKSGWIQRLSAATGDLVEGSEIDVGQPLGSAAVRIGKKLLLAGIDGTLYAVEPQP